MAVALAMLAASRAHAEPGQPPDVEASAGEKDAAAAQQAPGAPDESQKEKAKKYFEEGVKLFDAADYGLALEAFRMSFSLVPHWKIRYNIATCLMKLGQDVEALREFTAFLDEAGPSLAKEEIKKVEEIIGSLKTKVAVIKLSGLKEGDLVEIDGKPPTWSKAGKTILVMPGIHDVKLTRDGEVLMDEGIFFDSGQEKVIQLFLTEKTVKIETPAAGAMADKPVKPVGGTDASMPGGGPMKKAGWSLLGVGLALLAGGAVTGGLAVKEKGAMDDDADRFDEAASEAERLALAADVDDHYHRAMALAWSFDALTAAGAAAAIAGVVLAAVGAKKEAHSADGTKGAVSLTLGALPGGMTMNLSF